MKVTVTYDKEDILQLIHKDLLANGLKHDLASAKYKGTARVTIEVEGTPGEVQAPAPSVEALVPVTTEYRERTPVEVQEEEPVGDMSAILAQSNKNAQNKKPLYPTPTRTMMDGESEEWPGVPEPRGR